MAIKIGFLTGARSEYGITKSLLRELDKDERFHVFIYPNGMHLLHSYGHTVDEIYKDGFQIAREIPTYQEKGKEKGLEFSDSLKGIYEVLSNEDLDGVFLLGDRIEAYTAALAAYFANIPVFHMGGGHLTKGAVDNIYRFNISNLADQHLVVTEQCRERLAQQALIDEQAVHYVGSLAVDSIIRYQNHLPDLYTIIPELKDKPFALITFHPVTGIEEPIPAMMNKTIEYIRNKGYYVLITYPNNDQGANQILEVINQWSDSEEIHISKNLGAELYYAALKECKFVIGNSSSGLVEAPYFEKPVLNVGQRQEGREKDPSVTNLSADTTSLKKALEKGFNEGWKKRKCHYVFGNGNAAYSILKVLENFLLINSDSF